MPLRETAISKEERRRQKIRVLRTLAANNFECCGPKGERLRLRLQLQCLRRRVFVVAVPVAAEEKRQDPLRRRHSLHTVAQAAEEKGLGRLNRRHKVAMVHVLARNGLLVGRARPSSGSAPALPERLEGYGRYLLRLACDGAGGYRVMALPVPRCLHGQQRRGRRRAATAPAAHQERSESAFEQKIFSSKNPSRPRALTAPSKNPSRPRAFTAPHGSPRKRRRKSQCPAKQNKAPAVVRRPVTPVDLLPLLESQPRLSPRPMQKMLATKAWTKPDVCSMAEPKRRRASAPCNSAGWLSSKHHR